MPEIRSKFKKKKTEFSFKRGNAVDVRQEKDRWRKFRPGLYWILMGNFRSLANKM